LKKRIAVGRRFAQWSALRAGDPETSHVSLPCPRLATEDDGGKATAAFSPPLSSVGTRPALPRASAPTIRRKFEQLCKRCDESNVNADRQADGPGSIDPQMSSLPRYLRTAPAIGNLCHWERDNHPKITGSPSPPPEPRSP